MSVLLGFVELVVVVTVEMAVVVAVEMAVEIAVLVAVVVSVFVDVSEGITINTPITATNMIAITIMAASIFEIAFLFSIYIYLLLSRTKPQSLFIPCDVYDFHL